MNDTKTARDSSGSSAVSSRLFHQTTQGPVVEAAGVIDTTSPVFGIKGKLQAAFIALAALTLLACIVAWMVFGHIERAVTEVTDGSVPEITLALTIAELSSEVDASAPNIRASQSQAERISARETLDNTVDELRQSISDWQDLGLASATAADLESDVASISGHVIDLDRAVSNMIELAGRRREKVKRLSESHPRFLEVLEPLIDDAFFNLIIENERLNSSAASDLEGLLNSDTAFYSGLLQLKTEINLAAGILGSIGVSEGPNVIDHFKQDLGALRLQIENSTKSLKNSAFSSETAALTSIIEAYLVGLSGLLEATSAKDDFSLSLDRERLSEVHDDTVAMIDPLIESARRHMISEAQEIDSRQAALTERLIDTGTTTLHSLLTIRAEGNLAAGLLSEAAAISEADRLEPLAERFHAAVGQIGRAFGQLPQQDKGGRLWTSIEAVLDLGSGEDGLFQLRDTELNQLDIAHKALDQSSIASNNLVDRVAELVDEAETGSRTTAEHAQSTIGIARIWMAGIAVVSLLGALLVMLAYVGPRIIRPIQNITQAMSKLAGGDTTVDIPGRDRNDEIGRMAKAMGVFRDITISIQESNLKEIDLTRRRLVDAIESISEAFSLYDSEDTLIVCNRKYGTLVHPEIADEIVPGLSFEQIVRRSLELGLIAEAVGREEEWLAQRLKKHRNPEQPHIMNRHTGQWIMVSERRTSDGGVVAVYSDITELKERENELAEKSMALEQLSNQLSKYLSPQIYQSIFTGEQHAVVASKRKKLTVFFSDLVGFTQIADRLESEDLTHILNQYLTEMSTIALKNGATIDKYIGDALMIFFGDPVSEGVRQDALKCVSMAIEMQARLSALNDEWREYGLTEPMMCRVGIATGFCTVGNFGSEDRMDYTIIGGTVNLASRLEGLAEPGSVLVSSETQSLIEEDIICEEHGTVSIKGLAYPATTYKVVGPRGVDTARADPASRIKDKIRIDTDLASLSETERKDMTQMLQGLLDKISQNKG